MDIKPELLLSLISQPLMMEDIAHLWATLTQSFRLWEVERELVASKVVTRSFIGGYCYFSSKIDSSEWTRRFRALRPNQRQALADALFQCEPTVGGLRALLDPTVEGGGGFPAAWRGCTRELAPMLFDLEGAWDEKPVSREMIEACLPGIERVQLERGLPLDPVLRRIAAEAVLSGRKGCLPFLVTQSLLAGEVSNVEALLDQLEPSWTAGLLTALVSQDYKRAATLYGKPAIGEEHNGLAGLMRSLVLATSDAAAKKKQAVDGLYAIPGSGPLVDFLLGRPEGSGGHPNPFYHLHCAVGQAWSGGTPEVRTQANLAKSLGWQWIAAELEATAGGPGLPNLHPLVQARKVRPYWETLLDSLEAKVDGGIKVRYVWVIDLQPFEIEVQKQTLSRGTWSAGRSVGIGSFFGMKEPLPPEDHAVRATGAMVPYDRFQAVWDTPALFRALAVHPRVVDRMGTPLRVEVVRPSVMIREVDGLLEPVFDPPPGTPQRISREGNVVRYVEASPALNQLLAPLQGRPLRVPKVAQERLFRWLGQLGEEVEARGTTEVAGEVVPVLCLRPVGEGLGVSLRVQPAGANGALYIAGEGPSSFVAQGGSVGGDSAVVLRIVRALDAEKEALAGVLTTLPSLGAAMNETPTSGLVDLATGLELLDLVQAQPSLIRVAWQEGAALRLRRPKRRMRVVPTGKGGWFQLVGDLVLEDERVVSLVEVLSAARAGGGRFLRLNDGSFVALTLEMRRQLAALSRLARVKGDKVEVHELGAELLEPLVEDSSDPAWVKNLRRRAEVPADPPIPGGLTATLRPYQEDGVRWLIRLSHWAQGACLADDMGLGKTITALALLLHRQTLGPALVVAPASVVSNWQREAFRFAPGLRVRDLAVGDRDIRDLRAGDLLLCSYGLLATEAERLAGMSWATVVLDEAHQIKNAATLRHKSARKLTAGFRLALTGTPVENRLEELHALLQFVAPDFLGNEREFRERFVMPVTEGDREVSRTLRRVVSPLLLRRTKEQVLDDLPSRTDIDVPVALEPEHAAIYEVLRREAEGALAKGENQDPLHMLALLTRLRLAACHPALVGYPAASSSKHERLRELLLDLRASGHKALVFSQFVKHLELVRSWMDAEKVSYAWLDGGTSRAARDKAVNAFQAGEHDFFLLSLKAGGAGLNLTAADYVIHLDPWWNPAVEDQASDRAHRIGQQRPVTVYRLVSQGTVEEKILALHRSKRDLADQILAESHVAAGLDTRQLLSLLREATGVA